MKRHSERGNMLWFILLAIVLLGLLTMILSRSGTNVDQNASVEQSRIKSSQMMRYAKSIELAIDQMKINGVSENEINFNNTVTDIDYSNASCDTSADPHYPDCMIFEAGGTGLSFQNFSYAGVIDGINDSVLFYNAAAVNGIGTAAADLMFVTPVTQTLCDQINHDLGVTVTAPADITAAINDWDSPFRGLYITPSFLIGGSGVGEAPALNDKGAGCIIDNAGAYIFYQVLLAR